MKERVKFVLEWEKRWDAGEGKLNFAELCREFGISRQVGYEWVTRYQDARFNPSALKERSRRPHHSPAKVSDEVEELLVAARKARPTWGPKKLRAWLSEQYPKLAELPAQSTIGEVLRRRGLTVPRRLKRVRATQAATQPFADVTGPNATWCVDFKGHFRHARWARLLSAHPPRRSLAIPHSLRRRRRPKRARGAAHLRLRLSRIRIAGSHSLRQRPALRVGGRRWPHDALGLVATPWHSARRIEPGKPQQNGRQERFHRTLKAETAAPPRATLRAQQRAFDLFRRVYNHERLTKRSARNRPRPLSRFHPAAIHVRSCGS